MSLLVNRLYEFGAYRLDPAQRLLLRSNQTVVLPPKTFDLLLILVQSGGRAISKSDLMQSLWPDTFVEEANLPFQISALRKALGEDGAVWIETLPKHGYRFTAPVRRILSDQASDTATANSGRPGRPWLPWLVAAGVALLAAGAVIRQSSGPSNKDLVPVPLTSDPGREDQATFSPDGNQVAFSWNGPDQRNFDIYVKVIGSESSLRLTFDRQRIIVQRGLRMGGGSRFSGRCPAQERVCS